MAKKQRKKKTTSQRIVKGQTVKDSKTRMSNFVKAAGIEEAYDMMPRKEKDLMFSLGMKPFGILPVTGRKKEIPTKALKGIKKITYEFLKYETISISENGAKISLYDYYHVGEPLRFFLRNFNPNCRNREQILKGFETFMQYTDINQVPKLAILELEVKLSKVLSSPIWGYTLFQFDFYGVYTDPPSMFNCYYVNMVPPQKVKVSINNNTRTVYRLGFPHKNEVIWVYTYPDKIGIKSNFNNLKIDVYIQKHALERLYERIDCVPYQIALYALIVNVQNFKTVTNKQGKSLIKFYLLEKKMGYLTYEYVEGIIIITTFLFITNNGTPEGEKLQNMLGVLKMDKQYLGIDKLSAFTSSDLTETPIVSEAFKEAGCDDLFELPSELKGEGEIKENLADKFIEYLELDKTEEALEIYTENDTLQ